MYSDEVKITLIPEERKVSISIRLSETTVIVKKMSIADFKIQVDQLKQALDNF